MKYLLDTCTFLWTIAEPKKLSKEARRLISAKENELYLSAVSVWELAIQIELKRVKIEGDISSFVPEQRISHSIQSVPLSEEASLHLSRLPVIHKDPFDRMLICQSLVHAMPLITPDKTIQKYPLKTIW